SQLKDVAWHAFDSEILVQGADEDTLRLEDDSIVRIIRDCASRGDRDRTRALSWLPPTLNSIIVNPRSSALNPMRDARAQHLHDLVKGLERHVAIRMGSAKAFKQRLLVPFFCRDFGDDLLRQDIQRGLEHLETVQLAASHGSKEGGAFHQLVARKREK